MTIEDVLHDTALDMGYTRFGLLPLEKVADKHLLSSIKDKYPWAKAIMVATWHYNFYQIPNILNDRVSKEILFYGRYLKASDENETAVDFEKYLADQNIKYFDYMALDKHKKYKVAEQMNIGLIRKNNYFYTEEGSHCFLHTWLIDQDIEFTFNELPPSCPGHCSRCIRNCPTKALIKGFDKDQSKCLVYTSKTGCDICQDVCLYNKDRWQEEETFLGYDHLDKLAKEEIDQLVNEIIHRQ